MAQVITQEELILLRRDWNGNGQRVVFVSGSFDLLNPGHIRLLEQARSHGDILVVGVQSDASVQAERAPEHGFTASGGVPGELTKEEIPRPITPAAERAEILAAMAAVDYVVEFYEPSLTVLLERLSPDVIVKPGSKDPRQPALSKKMGEGPGPKVVHVIPEPGFPI